MTMKGNAILTGVSKASFTKDHKQAVECGIAKSVSTTEVHVPCEDVNVTSVTDDVADRRMQAFDMHSDRRTTGNSVRIEFVLKVLLEKIGLSPSTGATEIASRLNAAQGAGQLTSEVNQVLLETLGSGNFTSLTVTAIESYDVVLDVVVSAPPTTAPTVSSTGNDRTNSSARDDSDDDMIYIIVGVVAGGAVFLIGGLVVFLKYFGQRAKIAPVYQLNEIGMYAA
jgi:hypothetical protein